MSSVLIIKYLSESLFLQEPCVTVLTFARLYLPIIVIFLVPKVRFKCAIGTWEIGQTKQTTSAI